MYLSRCNSRRKVSSENVRPVRRVAAEPFARLLSYLAGGGWSPVSKAPVILPVAQPRPQLAAAVQPWMVRRLGTGPAMVVLGWLYAVLASDAPGDRSSWVRRSAGGGRHVAASREEIASNTELSDDQVKRGLKKLREEGLIVASRGDGKTNIVVIPPEET